jgi:hypothetical protein
MKDDKKLPDKNTKQEIKVKKSPAAEALKRAPDEAIARAIHDALLKEKPVVGKHIFEEI